MPQTLKEQIQKRISRSPDMAFVRREFDSSGSYRQVSRAGSGILDRTKLAPSQLKRNFGQIVTFPATDAVGVALEVFPKLGDEVQLGRREEDRLSGGSTQIPAFGSVRVKGPSNALDAESDARMHVGPEPSMLIDYPRHTQYP